MTDSWGPIVGLESSMNLLGVLDFVMNQEVVAAPASHGSALLHQWQ